MRVVQQGCSLFNISIKACPKESYCSQAFPQVLLVALVLQVLRATKCLKRAHKKKKKLFRQGCPLEVYLSLSSDGQALEVMRVNEEHNHALTKQLYAHLPRQRAVSEEERKNVKDALDL